jgi:hypothetical protein
MKEPVKIAFGKHTKVKEIVQTAYRGITTRRPVRIECAEEYQVSDYWDGGSRNYCKLVKLDVMIEVPYYSIMHKQDNSMSLSAGSLSVEPGYCVVENTIFQGKDLGYTIIMNAADIPIHIPEAVSLLPTKPEPDLELHDDCSYVEDESCQELPEETKPSLEECAACKTLRVDGLACTTCGNTDEVYPQELSEKY